MLASRLGIAAVEALLDGKRNAMAGLINNELVFTPFQETITKRKLINPDLEKMIEILSI